jgi:hypothetical protein
MVRIKSQSVNGRGHNGQDEQQAEAEQPLTIRAAASVKATKTRWLWTGRFGFGFPFLLDGSKGKGKSALLCKLAAACTGGPPMPGERKKVHGSVIWLAGEEDEGTVRRKLEAAGANLRKCFFPELPESGETPTVPNDLHSLQVMAAKCQAVLMILDPLQANCSVGVNIEGNEGADLVMRRLLKWAAGLQCCVVCSRNLTKHTTGLDALAQGRGSGTLADRARGVLRLDRHPDQEGVFAISVSATNLAAVAQTWLYRLPIRGDVVSVEWVGPSDLDADRLAQDALDSGEQDARLEARRLLCQAIGSAWRAAAEILKEAEKAGVSTKTLRRAKADLRVPSRRSGGFGAAGFSEWGPPPGGWPKELRKGGGA